MPGDQLHQSGRRLPSCHEKIELALAEILAQQPRTTPAVASGKDPHWQSVVDTIAELRPHIQADGGDMALLSNRQPPGDRQPLRQL